MKTLLILPALLLLTPLSHSQITGRVTNSHTGTPLQHVNIQVKHTSYGATSNGEGRFHLEQAKPGDTLLLSHQGFQSLRLVAKQGLEIGLQEVAQELQEVVLVPKKFNLNFDAYTPGEALPEGWYKWGTYPLQTESAGEGRRQVVRITADEKKGRFGSVAYLIPANYVGDSIELSGYMKIEGVDEKSYAGLIMRIDGWGKNTTLAFDNMAVRRVNGKMENSQQVNGTRDWQRYSITLPFPEESAYIYVGGILQGTGKAWFDDLQVSIDGKDVQTLEEIVKASPVLDDKDKKELERHFRRARTRIDLQSETRLEESLEGLVERLGDKKIIAIGEDTHGTSEYYRLRAALTRKLVAEQGFNTIVLENPYDDSEMLFRNLQQQPLDSLMRRHLFSIYQTREMKSFLEWLKASGNSKQVRFTGCDDSYWVLPELMEEQIAQAGDREVSELFRKLQDATALEIEEFTAKYPGMEEPPATQRELDAMVHGLSGDLEALLRTKGLLKEPLREQLLHLNTTYLNYDRLVRQLPIITRDEMMAKRISDLAKDPEAKLIVWAHNAHISNAAVIDDEIGKMGEALKQEFGQAYHSIGMSSLEGSYSYITERFVNGDHHYDDELHQGSLQHQPPSSWETILAGAGDSYYLDLKALLRKEANPGKVEHLKLLGYSEESAEDYYQLSPFRMFDSLFFIRITTATVPLFDKGTEL